MLLLRSHHIELLWDGAEYDPENTVPTLNTSLYCERLQVRADML